MKTLTLLLLLCLFLSFSLSAHARIGESFDQCIQRYGEPVQRAGTQTLFFKKSGISITCAFRESRCVQISYKKLEPKARFTSHEVDILRTANGSNWKLQQSDSSYTYMRNETCENYHDHRTGLLQFETLAELDRKKQEKIAAEKKLLEGF